MSRVHRITWISEGPGDSGRVRAETERTECPGSGCGRAGLLRLVTSETFSAWFSGAACVFPRWLCTTIQISLALWGTCSLSTTMAARGTWQVAASMPGPAHTVIRLSAIDNQSNEHNNNNNARKLHGSSDELRFCRRQSNAANSHDTCEHWKIFVYAFPLLAADYATRIALD